MTQRINSISLIKDDREVAWVSFTDETVMFEDDLTFEDFKEVTKQILEIIENKGISDENSN